MLVDLPEAPSQPITDTEKDPLVVSIREDGAVFVNLGIQDANDPGTRVTIYSCRTKPARSCGRGPMCPSMLRRTTAWTMDCVVSVMTVLQKSGAKSVGLITDPPSVIES